MLSRRTLLGSSVLGATALDAAPAAKPVPVTAEVLPWQGKPTLHINGQPTQACFYALTDTLGGRWSFDELPSLALQDFASIGFRLFQVDLFLEDVWPKAGPIDITLARKQMQGVLARCPEAAIVIRWHLNAPRWWAAEHPDQLTAYANGELETIADRHQPVRFLQDDLRRTPRVSLASTSWRQMATEKTQQLLQALAKSPEGRALAGIHVACGVYGEWHYWGFMRNEPDVSAPMQQHFDRWRKAKGRAAVPVPNMAERAALDDGIFRDPSKRQHVIDYYRAQQELVAELILHFCGVVKRNWPRKLLTGTFYGYFFSVFNRSATGGHLELQKVLASPDVDYLSAPQAYGEGFRAIGGCGITRGLVESARLHGKLFLDEMDQTPSWQWRNDVDTAFRLSDLDADFALLRRNCFTSFTRGTGLWFYDFGPGNTAGWWADRRLMAEIKKIKEVLDRYHARPYVPAGDVLLVFDTEVFYYTGSTPGTDAITDPLAVNRLGAAAYASGAAIETIHLGDLARVDLARFRVVLFANTWLLTAAQRQFIQQKVMAPNRHVVFQGFPGYCDGTKLDVALAREATGLPLEKDAGGQLRIPGETGLARRGNVWFSTAPLVTAEPLREICRAAGAHLYSESNDVVLAGAGVVLLHSKEGGARQLRFRSGLTKQLALPAKCSWLFDAASGERLL